MGSGLFPGKIACSELDPERFRLPSRDRLNERKASLVAAIAELHGAADLGEERIVLADADIQARLDRCSTLTHDNRAAGDYLAAKRFHAQPLGI